MNPRPKSSIRVPILPKSSIWVLPYTDRRSAYLLLHKLTISVGLHFVLHLVVLQRPSKAILCIICACNSATIDMCNACHGRLMTDRQLIWIVIIHTIIYVISHFHNMLSESQTIKLSQDDHHKLSVMLNASRFMLQQKPRASEASCFTTTYVQV